MNKEDSDNNDMEPPEGSYGGDLCTYVGRLGEARVPEAGTSGGASPIGLSVRAYRNAHSVEFRIGALGIFSSNSANPTTHDQLTTPIVLVKSRLIRSVLPPLPGLSGHAGTARRSRSAVKVENIALDFGCPQTVSTRPVLERYPPSNTRALDCNCSALNYGFGASAAVLLALEAVATVKAGSTGADRPLHLESQLRSPQANIFLLQTPQSWVSAEIPATSGPPPVPRGLTTVCTSRKPVCF